MGAMTATGDLYVDKDVVANQDVNDEQLGGDHRSQDGGG
jgi:hypothetical protein